MFLLGKGNKLLLNEQVTNYLIIHFSDSTHSKFFLRFVIFESLILSEPTIKLNTSVKYRPLNYKTFPFPTIMFCITVSNNIFKYNIQACNMPLYIINRQSKTKNYKTVKLFNKIPIYDHLQIIWTDITVLCPS